MGSTTAMETATTVEPSSDNGLDRDVIKHSGDAKHAGIICVQSVHLITSKAKSSNVLKATRC